MTTPLTVLACPYREITRRLMECVTQIRRQSPCDVVTVHVPEYVPEYVVGHWREQLLHTESALRLKGRLLTQPGVMLTFVPYLINPASLTAGEVPGHPGPALGTGGVVGYPMAVPKRWPMP